MPRGMRIVRSSFPGFGSGVAAAAGALAIGILPSSSAAGAEPLEYPIEIAGQVILIKTTVNGRGPFTFILDTGATETVVTPPTARRVGIAGAAEPGAVGHGMAKTVAVGAVSVSDLPVLVVDPPQALSLRLDKGINYAGILGYTFLAPQVTTIDYRRQRVSFMPAGATAVRKPQADAAPGAIQIPFVIRDRLIHVAAFVNGQGPFTFLFDTGSAEVLLLPKAREALRLAASDQRADGVRFATLAQVKVGGAEVLKVPAIIQRPPQEGALGLTYDGILGYPFLSHFRVTINYNARMITLVPQ